MSSMKIKRLETVDPPRLKPCCSSISSNQTRLVIGDEPIQDFTHIGLNRYTSIISLNTYPRLKNRYNEALLQNDGKRSELRDKLNIRQRGPEMPNQHFFEIILRIPSGAELSLHFISPINPNISEKVDWHELRFKELPASNSGGTHHLIHHIWFPLSIA
ncbi:hypothetical protein WA026_007606 [Henosepilachna vigintioctopunctata]|uniref:Uncharacterized protein n=1 Tax=Henosepilachna vigintioctopunctata TaxID=420089 RepID=A0AAW1UUE2_9CUCU